MANDVLYFYPDIPVGFADARKAAAAPAAPFTIINGGTEMNKPRANQQRPRDAEGRFESKNRVQSSQDKASRSMDKQSKRCRNDMGRFESCDS